MALAAPLSFFVLPWLQCPLNLDIGIRKEVTCGHTGITQLCGMRERRFITTFCDRGSYYLNP
jgi:hypothetical protein